MHELGQCTRHLLTELLHLLTKLCTLYCHYFFIIISNIWPVIFIGSLCHKTSSHRTNMEKYTVSGKKLGLSVQNFIQIRSDVIARCSGEQFFTGHNVYT